MAFKLFNFFDKFFFLRFLLLFVLLFLIDKLLNELIGILVHPVNTIVLGRDFESELAYGILLLL